MAAISLHLATFNMHGSNCGGPMLQQLLNSMDIIAVQEHWLGDSNLGILLHNNNDFDMIAVSSMSGRLCNEILRGRPYGGTAIMWRRDTIRNVTSYQVPNNGRCVAMSFLTDTAVVFVFNVYLPCSSNISDEQEAEIMECMSFIEDTVVRGTDDGCRECNVILMGDFNASMHAIYNDSKYGAISSLLNDLNMIRCDNKNSSAVNYRYHHDDVA